MILSLNENVTLPIKIVGGISGSATTSPNTDLTAPLSVPFFQRRG